jgi:hypothetical protein
MYQTTRPGRGQVNCFFGGQCAFVPATVKRSRPGFTRI